jgi:hypothetical protein
MSRIASRTKKAKFQKKPKKARTITALMKAGGREFKVPPFVEIGSHTIPVTLDKTPREHGCFGYFEQTHNGAEIHIDDDLTAGRLPAVFFHELAHAINETNALGLSHRQVYGLGEGFAQAMGRWVK